MVERLPIGKLRVERPVSERQLFPHRKVEDRWIKVWNSTGIYKADDHSEKPPYFVLDMFPYPSGKGLHVGHVAGYTATDIIARYKRMNGFEVLHPMGWDAFGLPTENFAIASDRKPDEVTAENIATFRMQCIRSGFGIDWDREIDTSQLEYYKLTQELFLILYEAGLAYKAEAPANWCTGCSTVISNEQVQSGCCERCDSPVETRKIEQWFFKITEYADRLIDDLEGLDWPESTKIGQINWIGKQEGIEFSFNVKDGEEIVKLPVFTTTPELLERATFIAIAPEHPLAESLHTEEQKGAIEAYVKTITPQTEIERKKGLRDKTGVDTGMFVRNPMTGEDMPVWISDYVVMSQDLGVVMGVPSHNEKDADFARTYNLNFEPNTLEEAEPKDELANVIRNFGKKKKTYHLRDWLISRERYWGAPIPIVYCDDHGAIPVPKDQLPVIIPTDIEDFKPTGIPPLSKSESFMKATCPHCGGTARREAKTLDTFVDSSWYYIRFADPNNPDSFAEPELLKKWLPVDYYLGGTEHTNGHLLFARFITKALADAGIVGFTEPFLKLRHPGLIMGEDGRKMSKRWGNVVNPDDVSSQYGSDTLRIYEMFLGPLDQSKPWNTQAISGVRKFVDRVWNLQDKVRDTESTAEEVQDTNELIASITSHIESGKYNTAIADFMKYLNKVGKSEFISKEALEKFLETLAPFAPFITEELWSRLGNTESIHTQKWPIAEKASLEGAKTVPVQINGKCRGVITINPSFTGTEAELSELISQYPHLASQIGESEIKRIVYVPEKVLNILL